MSERFDEAYYAKHYGCSGTAVADAESTERLVSFIVAYARFLGVEIRSVLDLGCGEGLWRDPIGKLLPEASYRGVEVSRVMCEKHGWERSSIAACKGPGANLVVCQGVLQYLGDDEAERSIERIAELTIDLLYLEALTKRDWKKVVDQRITDGNVRLRRGRWYKKRLKRSFVAVGGGLFVRRGSGVLLFDLERAD